MKGNGDLTRAIAKGTKDFAARQKGFDVTSVNYIPRRTTKLFQHPFNSRNVFPTRNFYSRNHIYRRRRYSNVGSSNTSHRRVHGSNVTAASVPSTRREINILAQRRGGEETWP